METVAKSLTLCALRQPLVARYSQHMHIEMLTGRGTIDDFYGESGYLESIQRYPSQLAMRLLIDRLRLSESPLSAYGMTHMHELGLRTVDDAKTQEFVTISASDQHSYFIRYLMPEAQAPWPYAWVLGEANSVDDAAAMVLTAFKLSGAWEQYLSCTS